jgi:hypothetical protein
MSCKIFEFEINPKWAIQIDCGIMTCQMTPTSQILNPIRTKDSLSESELVLLQSTLSYMKLIGPSAPDSEIYIISPLALELFDKLFHNEVIKWM